MGEVHNGTVDVSNSFAVPFEEDLKNKAVWYLDHDYLETMSTMFKKISAKERIVGFYSTGPTIRSNDIEIHHLFTRFVEEPLLVIVDVRESAEGVPVKTYATVASLDAEKQKTRTFANVASEVGAYEAEEVGVEHLLRDINDPTVSSLAAKVHAKATGLRGLKSRLEEIRSYLEDVLADKISLNNQVVYNLQDIFNLLPNLNLDSLVSSFLVKTNDASLVIYLSSVIRSILSLHDLLKNKLELRAIEKAKEMEKDAATDVDDGGEGEDDGDGGRKQNEDETKEEDVEMTDEAAKKK